MRLCDVLSLSSVQPLLLGLFTLFTLAQIVSGGTCSFGKDDGRHLLSLFLLDWLDS